MRGTASGPLILVVDDDITVRQCMRLWLTKRNYRVEEAENGHEAVEKCGLHKVFAVLMDVTMPVLDGISASRIIRAAYPALPIIGHSAEASRASCLDAGMNELLEKPCSLALVEQRLQFWISQREDAQSA